MIDPRDLKMVGVTVKELKYPWAKIRIDGRDFDSSCRVELLFPPDQFEVTLE